MTERQQKALTTFAGPANPVEKFQERVKHGGFTFDTRLLIEPPLFPQSKDFRLNQPHWFCALALVGGGGATYFEQVRWQNATNHAAGQLVNVLLNGVGVDGSYGPKRWERLHTWLTARRLLSATELEAWLKCAPESAYVKKSTT